MPRKDLTGKVYNRLTVVSFKGVTGGRGSVCIWNCHCECGNEISVSAASLATGNTGSCGCYAKQRKSETSTKHGLRSERLYNIWLMMKQRCNCPNYNHYNNYGGRGIKVCDEWSSNFVTFFDWANANGYNKDLTLDRIDNSLNYHPDNCKWSTKKEQQNNRRNNVVFHIDGVRMTLSQVSEKHNITAGCLRYRLFIKKLSIQDALTFQRYK